MSSDLGADKHKSLGELSIASSGSKLVKRLSAADTPEATELAVDAALAMVEAVCIAVPAASINILVNISRHKQYVKQVIITIGNRLNSLINITLMILTVTDIYHHQSKAYDDEQKKPFCTTLIVNDKQHLVTASPCEYGETIPENILN